MIAALIDMAKTPEQISEEMKPYDEREIKASSVPLYPYGLCISLEEDSLKKLGLDGAGAEPGDGIQLIAMAKVTNASAREQADGSTRRCVELQITHMALGPEHTEVEVPS